MAGSPWMTGPIGTLGPTKGLDVSPWLTQQQIIAQQQQAAAQRAQQATQFAQQAQTDKQQREFDQKITEFRIKSDAENAKLARGDRLAELDMRMKDSEANRDAAKTELDLRTKAREEDKAFALQTKAEAEARSKALKDSELGGKTQAESVLSTLRGMVPDEELHARAAQQAQSLFPDDPVAQDAFMRAIERDASISASAARGKAITEQKTAETASKASEKAGRAGANRALGGKTDDLSIAEAAQKAQQEFPDDPVAQAAWADELRKAATTGAMVLKAREGAKVQQEAENRKKFEATVRPQVTMLNQTRASIKDKGAKRDDAARRVSWVQAKLNENQAKFATDPAQAASTANKLQGMLALAQRDQEEANADMVQAESLASQLLETIAKASREFGVALDSPTGE